jgi:hypothetical protein
MQEDKDKKGTAMRFIASKLGKPVAGIMTGAVSATILSKHPEIWHLPEHGTVTLYGGLSSVTVTSSTSLST